MKAVAFVQESPAHPTLGSEVSCDLIFYQEKMYFFGQDLISFVQLLCRVGSRAVLFVFAEKSECSYY